MLGAKERNASFIFARRSSNQVSSRRTSAVENMRGWVDSGPSASAPSPSLLQYADPTGEFPQCLPVFPASVRGGGRGYQNGGPPFATLSPRLSLAPAVERPLEQRRTSGGKELRPVAPLAFGVRAFSALPRHFFRSWTTDKASSGTGDSSSQEVSPGWGSSYRHPPRTEMPSGPVLLPSTPPFPPLVLRCSSGRTGGGNLRPASNSSIRRSGRESSCSTTRSSVSSIATRSTFFASQPLPPACFDLQW